MRRFWTLLLLFFLHARAVFANNTEEDHHLKLRLKNPFSSEKNSQPHAKDRSVPPRSRASPTPEEPPWLTGTLIAPLGTAVPLGEFEIDSYVYYTVNTGFYGKHWGSHSTPNFYTMNPAFFSFFGITPWADIHIFPGFAWNRTQGRESVQFQDLPIGIDVQLYPPDKNWFPGIKATVREIFPTGKYQNLDPQNLGTDSTGQGAYGTAFNLVLYKLIHLTGRHFLSLTASALYTVNTSVHVNGFNAYGGGFGTNGTVFPGNSFQGALSFEFTLSQNWVVAFDSVYTHVNQTTFSGNPGVTASGNPAKVGFSSSEQISFAPAIEYNFTGKLGIIAGAWFSAAGRNSTRFTTGILEFVYTY